MNIYLLKREKSLDYQRILREICTEYAIDLGFDNDVTGALEKASIEHTSKGKPYFKGIEQIHFSISHTKDIWGCAICSEPLGFDIESASRYGKSNEGGNNYSLNQRWMKVAERFFTQAEYDYVVRKGQEAFLQLWVFKEAYFKYIGTGLSRGISSIELIKDGQLINRLADGWVEEVHVGTQFKAAYCSKEQRTVKMVCDL